MFSILCLFKAIRENNYSKNKLQLNLLKLHVTSFGWSTVVVPICFNCLQVAKGTVENMMKTRR